MFQELATELSAEGKGLAEVMEAHSEVAVGQAERPASLVQDAKSDCRLATLEGAPWAVAQEAQESLLLPCQLPGGPPCGTAAARPVRRAVVVVRVVFIVGVSILVVMCVVTSSWTSVLVGLYVDV